MSKIYDALIKLENHKRPRAKTVLPRWRNDKAAPLGLPRKGISLEWRIIGTIAGTMLVLGLLLVAAMSQLMGRALRAQIDQRALVITINLSESAAGHVLAGNILELHALVTKYARLDGSAYAFIEDSKGRIVAHSLSTFPPELADTLTMNERRRVDRRVVSLQGKTVYETRTPILEGQAGAAHIGIWGETVATEIYTALLPIVGLITGLLLAAVVLSVFLGRRIIPWLINMASKTRVGE